MNPNPFKTLHAFLLTLVLVVLAATGNAQTTYNITANKTWSAVLPTSCFACTINISTGITLTIDKNETCQNCVFSGGTISMDNQTLNIQYAGPLTTTSFNNTTFNLYNGAKMTVNAPLSLSHSTFNFNDQSQITTSYEVDLTASQIYLKGKSSFTANGSSSTPINLIGNSRIAIGDGTLASKAIFTVSGPSLNIYDQSGLTIGNQNNTYYNWSKYNYSSSFGTPATPSSFSTSTSGMNCGSGFANGCSNPSLFGPSTLTAAGAVQGITLPVILTGFSSIWNSNKTITLDWNTQMEQNSSRFVIQRSNDGGSWTDIGTVRAGGNSSLPTDYSFTDEHPAAGINYYRLRMEDLDNSYQYTQIVAIRTSVVNNISFFPNPARDYVNVSLGQTPGATVTIRLINQSGQVLQEKQAEAGSNTILSFPVQRYATGLYILSVSSSDGFRECSKLLISRS